MISRIANAIGDLDGLSFVASLVAGLGALGYVIVKWAVQLTTLGHSVLATMLSVIAAVIALLAIVRVPLAQLALLASAVTVGVGFATGTQHFFLP